MSNQNVFNGARLKKARMYRGFTLKELSERIEVSKQSLSLYENNKNKPELENIFKLSKVLKFPHSYFFQKEQFDISTDTTYFRSLISTNKRDRTSQIIKLEFISQLFKVLNKIVEFPKLNLPTINFPYLNIKDEYETKEELDEIENIAQTVRNYWNISNGPISDIDYLFEANGILISSLETNANKIDAFSQLSTVDETELFIIGISKGQSQARAMFDFAHELGHIVLHPWTEDLESIPNEEFKARERQANAFAGAFLLPKETFKKEVSYYPIKLEYYLHLKKKWNVSIAAMIYRARQLEVLSYNQYQYLMRQISSKGWRNKEPLDTPFNLSYNLFQNAIDLITEKNFLNINEIIQIFKESGIHMNISEIEDLLDLRRGTLTYEEVHKDKIIKLKV